jgi:hypothetical protein
MNNQFKTASHEAENDYFENNKDIELYYTEVHFEIYAVQAVTDIENMN